MITSVVFTFFFVILASRADKSGIWNLPESRWLVRSKGSLDDDGFHHIQSPTRLNSSCCDNFHCHFLFVRCEVDEVDALEQASPLPDVVVERNEEFYDQSYVNDKENTASEVSLPPHQDSQVTFELIKPINCCLRPAECVQVAHRPVEVRKVLGWLV